MEQAEFYDFVYCEVKRIKIDKWVEGERIHQDPGVQFELDWVSKNAEGYRDAWEHSMCRTCLLKRLCGFNALSSCKKYEND